MTPYNGIELKEHHCSPSSSGGKKNVARDEVPKTVRIDQMMQDLRVRPSHALTVMKEVLRVVFESPTIHVDKFYLSLGELVGLAEFGETFHIPYHTDQEQQYIAALRMLCAKHLGLLLESHVLEDFEAFVSLPNWKREYRDVMVRVMQCMPPWKSKAVQTFWTLNRKILTLRGEMGTKGRGGQGGYTGGYNAKRQNKNKNFAHVKLLHTNDDYITIEQEVRYHKLDIEWYDRLLIMHKRNRQFLRTELDLYFENAILPKKSEHTVSIENLVSTSTMMLPHHTQHKPSQRPDTTDDFAKMSTPVGLLVYACVFSLIIILYVWLWR